MFSWFHFSPLLNARVIWACSAPSMPGSWRLIAVQIQWDWTYRPFTFGSCFCSNWLEGEFENILPLSLVGSIGKTDKCALKRWYPKPTENVFSHSSLISWSKQLLIFIYFITFMLYFNLFACATWYLWSITKNMAKMWIGPEKSRIRETLTLSTCADSTTYTKTKKSGEQKTKKMCHLSHVSKSPISPQ